MDDNRPGSSNGRSFTINLPRVSFRQNENQQFETAIPEQSRSFGGDNATSERVSISPDADTNPDRTEPSYRPDEGPPAKIPKLDAAQQDYDTCPICLDLYGNSGAHRLVALKCGHLFGEQCIKRWMENRCNRNRTCPVCNSRATPRDIRPIYCNKLVAADATQIAGYQRQIDILQTEKTRSDIEMENAKIVSRDVVIKLQNLKRRHCALIAITSFDVENDDYDCDRKFSLDKLVEINRDGGCRALIYNSRSNELYIARKSTNDLLPSFGISKVSCSSYRLGEYLHLHSEPIQDMTYSQRKKLLLTVSYDNTARIIDRDICSHTIQCGMPLTSCCWDHFNVNEFYVGGSTGEIYRYDVRNFGTHMNMGLQMYNSIDDTSRVVSLVSTECGLLICRLYTCCLWSFNRKQWELKSLPADAPFKSACFDNISHKLLVSCSSRKLFLYKVKRSFNDDRSTKCVVEHQETYSGIAGRNAFTEVLGEKWIAAYSQNDNSLNLHRMKDSRTICLPLSEPAVDICPYIDRTDMFAALTDSRLRIYKRTQPVSTRLKNTRP